MTRGGDIDNMKASRLKTPIQEFVADINYLYELQYTTKTAPKLQKLLRFIILELAQMIIIILITRGLHIDVQLEQIMGRVGEFVQQMCR